jgi:hypothetical protein
VRFHDLCENRKIPTSIKALLGLGLNFIPQPRYSTGYRDIDTDRFERDAHTKFYWSGKDETNNVMPKLFLRTNWRPNPNEINLEFRSRIHDFKSGLSELFTRQRCSSNLLPHQNAALFFLRHDTDFIVIKSDKNLGPCVVERANYVQRALTDHLSDKATYIEMDEATANIKVNELVIKINNFMNLKLNKKEHLSDLIYLKRYNASVKDPFSYFYLLAKVHKTPWKTRPIVSTCGSANYGIACWVDCQLKLIVNLLPYTVASSYELSLSLRKRTFANARYLYTSDAVSMYTNIDTDHAMSKITYFLCSTDYAARAKVDVKSLLSALEIVMYNNVFKFGDTFWHQLSGTAMGTPPAPNYATLYFAIHELEVIPRFPELSFYCRYLDDCFGVWTGTDDYRWYQFQYEFGNYGKLSWEYTTHKNVINFLDLDISLQEDGKIKTSLYEKALNLYLYLPPHSAHSKGVLRGLISGMILRIKRLTSEPTEVLECLQSFYRRLILRGYDKRNIYPLFQEYALKEPDIVLPDTGDPLFLHLKYHPKDPSSQQIQRNFRNILLEPHFGNRLPNLFNRQQTKCDLKRLIIAYSRHKNIGELISPRKLHTANGAHVSTILHGDDTSSAVNPNPNDTT